MRKPTKITKLKSTEIDPYVGSMLENIVEGKEILKLRKGLKVFSQGADAEAIYFIQSGSVEITIASVEAKEAVLATLGPRDFFGEGCLVGQSLRVYTATTTESFYSIRNSQASHAPSSSCSARAFRKVRSLFASPQHRYGRGYLRSAFQP